jgi:thiol-disulfide isomerase/thioredoxin
MRKLACLAALLLSGAFATAAVGADTAAPAPGFSLPLRGSSTPVSLERLRGQVVMINFWASWCGPCREEFPLLDQMQRKYKSAGFTLLGVNVEPDAAKAEEFLAKNVVSFPIAYDADSKMSQQYRVSGMPSTVLIDRHGLLRWVHRGYKPGDENEYLDQLRLLLREK